mgnify:CR=1 FL=1
MSQNTPANKKNIPTQDELMKKLLDFYWEVLKDTDLKPTDRIASAKRLEALLMAQNTEDTAPVVVTLNLPRATVKRSSKEKT